MSDEGPHAEMEASVPSRVPLGWIVVQEATTGAWRMVSSSGLHTKERAEEIAAQDNALEARVYGDHPVVVYRVAAVLAEPLEGR